MSGINLRNMTLVKNRNGTAELSCKCGTWLKHWENFTKTKAIKCSMVRCFNYQNLVGGHVIQCLSDDRTTYIVPICNSCNQKSSEECYDVGDTVLAPSNVAETCAK